jgi:hypothetical protein
MLDQPQHPLAVLPRECIGRPASFYWGRPDTRARSEVLGAVCGGDDIRCIGIQPRTVRSTYAPKRFGVPSVYIGQ